MLHSKIEVRERALDIAAGIMGIGTSDKDVVSKAIEIEKYLLGDAVLPETKDSDLDIFNKIAGMISGISGINLSPNDDVLDVKDLAKKDKKN